jgi:hypothetical protein
MIRSPSLCSISFVGLLILVLLLIPACGDDSGDGDGGATDQADHGRDIPRDTDASPDVESDPSTDPAGEPETGTVTIHLVENGAPVEAGEAAFHDSSGAAIGHETADEEGVIEVELPEGAMVTFVHEDGQDRDLTTIVGLQPGDEVIRDSTTATWTPPVEVGQLSVTISTAVEDANNYDFKLGYSGFGGRDIAAPIEGPVYDFDLLPDDTIDVLATAGVLGDRLAFATFDGDRGQQRWHHAAHHPQLAHRFRRPGDQREQCPGCNTLCGGRLRPSQCGLDL